MCLCVCLCVFCGQICILYVLQLWEAGCREGKVPGLALRPRGQGRSIGRSPEWGRVAAEKGALQLLVPNPATGDHVPHVDKGLG